MKIIKFPDTRLFQKCSEVTDFGPSLKEELNNMWSAMFMADGMGLAANQVGIMKRMFVMQGPFRERLSLVNPVIVSKSQVSANINEGCLSAPGESLNLAKRMNEVTVRYKDEYGAEITQTFTGVHAVCVQHEIDHLDGISFLESDDLSRQQRRAIARKWGIKNK